MAEAATRPAPASWAAAPEAEAGNAAQTTNTDSESDTETVLAVPSALTVANADTGRDLAAGQTVEHTAAIAARSTEHTAAVVALVVVVARDTAIASIENIRVRRHLGVPSMRAEPLAGLAAAGGVKG